jgi:hypothetical protein
VRSDHKDVIFKEVLLACTLSKHDSLGRFTARAVADQLSKVILGKTYDVPQFSYHLKAFCDERRGGILEQFGSARHFSVSVQGGAHGALRNRPKPAAQNH